MKIFIRYALKAPWAALKRQMKIYQKLDVNVFEFLFEKFLENDVAKKGSAGF